LLLELGIFKPEIRDSIPVDPDPQNPLQALKKLILVSQVNLFEFFFDSRKQVQVTSSQIR
jgi:hypothetical protein